MHLMPTRIVLDVRQQGNQRGYQRRRTSSSVRLPRCVLTLSLKGYGEYVTLRTEAVVRIPTDVDPAEVCPLLCAGVTTFNCELAANIPAPSPADPDDSFATAESA